MALVAIRHILDVRKRRGRVHLDVGNADRRAFPFRPKVGVHMIILTDGCDEVVRVVMHRQSRHVLVPWTVGGKHGARIVVPTSPARAVAVLAARRPAIAITVAHRSAAAARRSPPGPARSLLSPL